MALVTGAYRNPPGAQNKPKLGMPPRRKSARDIFKTRFNLQSVGPCCRAAQIFFFHGVPQNPPISPVDGGNTDGAWGRTLG